MTREKRRSQQAAEDYLKAIYTLSMDESPVSTSRIAGALGVKPASVTNMLQRLAGFGLVDYEKHYGVTLTEAGELSALETIRNHRLIELYLTEALGFGWDEVHEEAEILEHVISGKFAERIAAIMGNPTFDPHGEPIPSRSGEIEALPGVPVTTLSAGDQATVSRIGDDTNGDLLRYLAGLGIVPGAVLTVLELAPFEGPLTIMVEGAECVVGRRAAELVFVIPIHP